MDITHYSFAFFVFVLVCVLILLYGRISRGKKKDDAGSFEKEQRLFRLYQNIEDMLGSFEEYAEESKKEISRGLERMEALKDEANESEQKAENTADISQMPAKSADIKPEQSDSALKPEDRIPLLIEKGMKKNEIAKELGLTIREVTLIMDIKKIEIPDDKS